MQCVCAQCILSVHTSTINSETRYAGSVASLFTMAVCCYSTNSCLLSLWRIMSQATKQSCPSDFFFSFLLHWDIKGEGCVRAAEGCFNIFGCYKIFGAFWVAIVAFNSSTNLNCVPVESKFGFGLVKLTP